MLLYSLVFEKAVVNTYTLTMVSYLTTQPFSTLLRW